MKIHHLIPLFITLALLTLALFATGCGRASYYSNKGCHVTETPNGAVIECDDGSSAVVYNGEDGTDGVDGEDGIDGTNPILATLDPCGDDPGHVDEILLVIDGGVIAWYKNKGLTLLAPNVNYVTTDHQKCQFSIDENYNLVY